jgi:hypothetical protein
MVFSPAVSLIDRVKQIKAAVPRLHHFDAADPFLRLPGIGFLSPT